jgi:hypothetical protein
MSSAPKDYMKEDIYLVKYLKASKYDPAKAASMMNTMIQWRQEKGVDNWEQDEKLNAFESEYPSLENGKDKDGRPVREAPYGKWNILTAVPKLSALNDYAVRSMERCTVKVREQQSKGKDVSQWTLLLNLEGFTPVLSACVGCMPLYMNYVQAYEKYYPNTIKEIILVNAPPTFNLFLTGLKATVMKPSTAELITVFGPNKSDWQTYVNERVASDQLAEWFGGSKSTPSGGGLLG